MVTITKSGYDISENEDRETDDSMTGSVSLDKTRKAGMVSPSLYEKIDSLFTEIEKNDEEVQTASEFRNDSYSQSQLTNEERIKLLARKYIKKLSSEESARLEILCERVRRLFPRATLDDFKRLEEIGIELKDFEEENERIIGKYNLD